MGAIAATRPVDAVMRRHWIAVEARASLYEAELTMRLARLRHLPVVEEEDLLVGVLSHRELVHAALERAAARPTPGYLRAIPVEQVMECEVSSLEAGASVRDAVEAMVETGRGCVPVVEPVSRGLRLVGIVTESDLIRLAFQNGHARPAPRAGGS